MSFPDSLIVSVSGIRGRVGIDLDPEVVVRTAAAFGAYITRKGWAGQIAVARDSRPSGPVFVRAATAGLQAVGCRVCDLGLVPTPTALLAIEERGLAGGIVVTASHNPREWNALKLAGPEGTFLTPEQGRELVADLRSDLRPPYVPEELGDAVDAPGSVARHIERILELPFVDAGRIGRRRFKVVLDCAHGAGGVIMPGLLERLGCEVVGIEMEPHGRFSREPEPIPENLTTLRERVGAEAADLGMAVDPDVDRLALVDETGRAIGEDFTLALAVKLMLRHGSGPVVANMSTSQIVEVVAREAGAPYRRAAVGEANVAAEMRRSGALVGGEGNGGVILPTLHLTRDAPLAAALILQLLAEMNVSLSRIVASYPQYCIVKERYPRGDVEVGEALAEIERAFDAVEVDRRDGLYLSWPERQMWLHCRPSGTEPILRVIAEGPSENEPEVRDLVEGAGMPLRRWRAER
jgi:phosphomannomutase